MICSLWNNCTPRRASPGIMLAASPVQATTSPAAITRCMNIAGLLFTHSKPGQQHVGPEALVTVNRLPETIPSPLGVPLYVLENRHRQASQRLVIARRP